MSDTKLVVLDDDPTGSQTVHSCLLLTRWDTDTLRDALLDEAPLFFVLTNTRGMDVRRAADITREVCRNLKHALDDLARAGRSIEPIVISRQRIESIRRFGSRPPWTIGKRSVVQGIEPAPRRVSTSRFSMP